MKNEKKLYVSLPKPMHELFKSIKKSNLEIISKINI